MQVVAQFLKWTTGYEAVPTEPPAKPPARGQRRLLQTDADRDTAVVTPAPCWSISNARTVSISNANAKHNKHMKYSYHELEILNLNSLGIVVATTCRYHFGL
jgi:hypothetical protein